MSPIVQRNAATQGETCRMGPSRTNQSSSSMTSSGAISDKQSSGTRASTPSKYLRRTGLVPNGTNLNITTRHITSILSSSSSSTVTSPSSAPPNPNIGSRSLAVQPDTPDTPSLPTLTESNLARFMAQSSLSGRLYPVVYSSNPPPHTALEISYFSDGSSTHSGSDCESSEAGVTCQ